MSQAQDLRRHLSTADRRPTASWCCEAWSGSGWALRGVSRIQRGRPTPAHRHFGSATSRTRTPNATRHQAACEPLRGFGSSPIATTRRSRQGGAPHRTNDLDGDKRRRTLGGAETALLTTEGSRKDALAHQADPVAPRSCPSVPIADRRPIELAIVRRDGCFYYQDVEVLAALTLATADFERRLALVTPSRCAARRR